MEAILRNILCRDARFWVNRSQKENAWSKDEYDRLFEGIFKYGRNWKPVAEHVGTRSYFSIKVLGTTMVQRLKAGKLADQISGKRAKKLMKILTD